MTRPARMWRLPSLPLVALAWLSVGAGCVKELPPAETPEQVVPAVEVGAPAAEGSSRLVVDIVDGAHPVHRIHMESEEVDDGTGHKSWQFYERSELLCQATPCVADLPPGNVLLGFPLLGDPGVIETELVHVGAAPEVYRRSLSLYEDDTGAGRVLGIIGTVLGASAAITGTVLLPVGLRNENWDLALAGGITLGAGAALMALSIWAITLDAPTLRPGSSAQFALPGASAPAQ